VILIDGWVKCVKRGQRTWACNAPLSLGFDTERDARYVIGREEEDETGTALFFAGTA